MNRQTSARIAAIVEVTCAFALMHLAFRAVKNFTPVGRLEWKHDVNFSAGAALIGAAFVFMLIRKRAAADYGISIRNFSRNVNIGVASVIVVGVIAAISMALGMRRDPTWSDPTLGMAATGLQALASIVVIWVVYRGSGWIARWPSWLGAAFMATLVAAPMLVRAAQGKAIGHTAVAVASIIVSASIAEEVFFFGYMQSRLNEAFGKPWRLMDTACGWGLVITAVFFGLVHVLNPFDYFRWEGRLAWWWGCSSAASLWHGLLRERSGSIAAPAVVHAFMDIASRGPGLVSDP